MAMAWAPQAGTRVQARAGEEEADSAEVRSPLSDLTTGMVRQVTCHTQAYLPHQEDAILKARMCPTKPPEIQQEHPTHS